jgi:hypothetical protein
VSKSAITPTSTTFSTSSTTRINALSAPVKGLRKISRPARPKIATAAVTVAKISTMMSARSAPTAINWRFSTGSEDSTSSVVRTERFSVGWVALAGASVRISDVVEEMAAVMRVSCWPTLGMAAVFSSSEEEGERVARVASAAIG